MNAARKEQLDEDALELVEVPAAVVCAQCGDPECPGCVDVDEPTQASGVVAVIPWERPGATPMARMISTARLSTLNADSLFGSLPGGEVSKAMKFAMLVELLAISSLAVLWAPVIYALAPDFWQAVWAAPAARRTLVSMVVAGIPAAAAAMVALHVVWGLALELGVRRVGGKPSWKRGLRFAAYSCGWDLVTSPFGFIALTLADGPAKAVDALKAAVRVPRKAPRAYARGAHKLSLADAKSSVRIAWFITATVVLVGLLFIGVAAVSAAGL